MKISTILDSIDNGQMALPEFQRSYVWKRHQMRSLFDSLYHDLPVGCLLVWETETKTAAHRGGGELPPGMVKLLLDGQQRITTIYSIARGKPPKFFDGNPNEFTGLHFHLETEDFEFYQPVKMRDDFLWIDVTELIKNNRGYQNLIKKLNDQLEDTDKIAEYLGRAARVAGILSIELYIDTITGQDKTLDLVVDIFNRVNSQGTKLSKGDLAMAKICAEWPEGRNKMKNHLKEWQKLDFYFTLEWLLRSVNTTLTGKAQFHHLHNKSAKDISDGLNRATNCIGTCLDLIGARLGLDHQQVLFGHYGIPVMVRYLDQRDRNKLGPMNEEEKDKLLFWYVQAAMWGRFSGSTESTIDKDLSAIDRGNGNLDELLELLRLSKGSLRVESGHFAGSNKGSRFYPVFYLLTRMGEALDWGTGIPLKDGLLGKMSRLEVHHIFPKSQLYSAENENYTKQEVNAVANFCLLTQNTNLTIIRNKLPEVYFPEVEAAHPGSLKSQWIPTDQELWKLNRYRDFLEARRELLAKALNSKMENLLHGDMKWLAGEVASQAKPIVAVGGISSEEEAQLEELNSWVANFGFPRGTISYDYSDTESGDQLAIFDLAWPNGLQEGLTDPVVVLLNAEPETISFANQARFRYFTSIESFKKYVQSLCNT